MESSGRALRRDARDGWGYAPEDPIARLQREWVAGDISDAEYGGRAGCDLRGAGEALKYGDPERQ